MVFSNDHVNVQDVQKLMAEVRKIHKNNNKPVRRCCSESEDFDVICPNSNCQSRGKSDSCNDNGRVENGSKNGEENYDSNGMEEINALGLHRMENPSHVDAAVSLHLYSPPFNSCRVFDARTGAPTSVSVTFTSMYGKKVKRVIEAVKADSQ
ncbi:Cysteine dioxygenase type I domain containing protein [Operophtera brumata]|uniref:Cysteine dioxygenase n=1 Tax=Operophtera brumata TaxID=104452 RepID=A0A0L7L5T3_OPEBR|nr:Cysteine dioxygenase type I domain containing protein [Operophtera brumata]